MLNAQADHYFNQRLYEMSAQTYAQTQRSFEEVTLKFVNTGATNSEARNALKVYLKAKLERLQPSVCIRCWPARFIFVVLLWLSLHFVLQLNSVDMYVFVLGFG